MIAGLAAYLFTAILTWTGLPADCSTEQATCDTWSHVHFEKADDARTRFNATATQIAKVASAFATNLADGVSGEYSPDVAAYRALELLAIAEEESGFHKYVDDGTCNREAKANRKAGNSKRDPRGDCDGGDSFGDWQIQPGWMVDRIIGRPTTGWELVADRKLSVVAAWGIRDLRPSAWTVWPRARVRARDYARSHSIADAILPKE
jgi:hypothetical protein